MSAPFDERVVGGDEVPGEHSGVAAGGVEVEVPQHSSGDVQWQAAVDGVGGVSLVSLTVRDLLRTSRPR